jgi:hypothetical protein
MSAVEGSLRDLLDQQSSNKFTPDLKGETKHSLSFLTGTTGIIPLFTLALSSFPSLKKRLIEAIKLAGNQVWAEGL